MWKSWEETLSPRQISVIMLWTSVDTVAQRQAHSLIPPRVLPSARAFPHIVAPFLKQLLLLCNLVPLLPSKALPVGGCSRPTRLSAPQNNEGWKAPLEVLWASLLF